MTGSDSTGQAQAEYAMIVAVFAGIAILSASLIDDCVTALGQAVKYMTDVSATGF